MCVSILHRIKEKGDTKEIAGLEVQDLYEDLEDCGPINASTDNEYKISFES